ncbi:MAG: VWA domain-containing protein [Akkermansiaceae bacterium]
MDDTPLQFAQPLWIFVGLLVCAGIVALFIRFDRRREADLAKLIHPRFRLRLTDGFSPRLRNIKRGLWLAAVLMIFSAIARPQKGYEWNEVKRKGIDILFAVDTSRSMLAEDLAPNRLERARIGIIDFVGRLEGDRVGLIPFAGSAFALCPLTLDYDAFQESLNALDTDIIPRQGTDIASAIREAERLFDKQGNNHRVLVLLTDGEDLEGAVIDVAKAAAKKGMVIYTVGVGSPEGAAIPIRYPNGRMDYLREADGTVVKTVLDESTLKKIAEETEGLYVPLGRGAEGLNTIYQERLRLVPKSELEQRMERIPLERFEWPLGLAIVLLLAEFFMNDRRKLKQARALPKLAALLALGFVSTGTHESRAAEADPRKVYNQGTEAYLNGDFTAATEALKASLRTQDLKLQQGSYYNLGNTLYRTGQEALEKDPEAAIKAWEEAVKAYEDALALNPNDEDAVFNKELVARKLEELKQQEKQEDEDSEKDEEKKEEDEEEKNEEGEPEDDSDSKDGEKGDEDKESEKPEEGDESSDPQDGDSSEDPQEGDKSEEPTPGEGDEPSEEPADAKPEEEKSAEEKEGESSEERGEKEQMTEEEALQLIESLRDDDRRVIPIPRGDRKADNTTKGKTW